MLLQTSRFLCVFQGYFTKKKTPQNQIKFSDTMSIKLAVQTIREL